MFPCMHPLLKVSIILAFMILMMNTFVLLIIVKARCINPFLKVFIVLLTFF